ncbi:DUF5695 domain-containing protein [Duganella callida]|uniref:Uncharacterized protein n=1 Tax=Duganella callida TaxID=2561932 RepID=A0A4Y9SCY9_9BURK|nr:DUF5695 domain-containing protein [Duganella callida]TFW18331.1 hypothetical protein E4L98_18670 [Duganella callida]
MKSLFALPLLAALSVAAVAAPIETKAYSTPQLLFALRTDTQTLARLVPVSDPSFDFTPGPREEERQADGYAHLGDLTLRTRLPGGEWHNWSSFAARKPVRPELLTRTLAAADMSPTMGAGLPLKIERRWLVERGALVLRFTLTNISRQRVEVAAPAMPMVFDYILAGRASQEGASAVHPRVGDNSSVTVTRLDQQPPVLRVEPDGKTPLTSWAPPASKIAPNEDYASWVTDGFTLAPGAKRSIGVRFLVR